MFSFHAAPVVSHEFPRSFATVCTAELLPFLDLVTAHFFVRGEFTNGPMRTFFDGLAHLVGIPNPLRPRKFQVARSSAR